MCSLCRNSSTKVMMTIDWNRPIYTFTALIKKWLTDAMYFVFQFKGGTMFKLLRFKDSRIVEIIKKLKFQLPRAKLDGFGYYWRFFWIYSSSTGSVPIHRYHSNVRIPSFMEKVNQKSDSNLKTWNFGLWSLEFHAVVDAYWVEDI